MRTNSTATCFPLACALALGALGIALIIHLVFWGADWRHSAGLAALALAYSGYRGIRDFKEARAQRLPFEWKWLWLSLINATALVGCELAR